ncbi:uncharacterized protein LOC144444199 [Glandiceps talaboti]
MTAYGLISMALAEDLNDPSPTMVNVPKSILTALEENKKSQQTIISDPTTKTDSDLNDPDAEINDNTEQEVDELIQDLLAKCDDELKTVEVTTDGVIIKDDLIQDGEKLQEYKANIKDNMSEMKSMTIQVQAKCDQLIEKVNQSMHKLISALEDRKAAMVEEIASAFRIQLDKLSLHKATLEEGLETTDELLQKVDNVKNLDESEFLDEAVDIKNRFILATNLVEILNEDHQAMKDTCMPLEFNMEVYINRKYKLRKLDLLRRSKKTMVDSITEQLDRKAKKDKENSTDESDSVLAAVGDTKKAMEMIASYCELEKLPPSYHLESQQGTSAVNNNVAFRQATNTAAQFPSHQIGVRNHMASAKSRPVILSQAYQTQTNRQQTQPSQQSASQRNIQYFMSPSQSQNLQVMRAGVINSQIAVPTGIIPARTQAPTMMSLQTIANYGQQKTNQMDPSSRRYVVLPVSSQVQYQQASAGISQTSKGKAPTSNVSVRSTYKPQYQYVSGAASSTYQLPTLSQHLIPNSNAQKDLMSNQAKKRKTPPISVIGKPPKKKLQQLKILSVKYKSDQDYQCRNRTREYNQLAYLYRTHQIKAFDVCFDECTAHPFIEVLNPKQIVYNKNREVVPCTCTPDTQTPFEGMSTSIFGSQPLPAEKCYWEILVRNCVFTIGVAFRQVARSHFLGYNAASWCVKYQPQAGMTFIHNCHQNPVSLYTPSITRLGVLLDREKGVLEFVNAEDKTTLVKVHTKFVSALYPVFGLGEGGSMSINAGFPYPSTILSKRKHVLYPQPSGGVPSRLPVQSPPVKQAPKFKPAITSAPVPTMLTSVVPKSLSAAVPSRVNVAVSQNPNSSVVAPTPVAVSSAIGSTVPSNTPNFSAVPVGIIPAGQLAVPVASGSTSANLV